MITGKEAIIKALYRSCLLIPFFALLICSSSSLVFAGDNDCSSDSDCPTKGGCAQYCDKAPTSSEGECEKKDPNCCPYASPGYSCCSGTLYDPTVACCNNGKVGAGVCGTGRLCCPIGLDDDASNVNNNRRCVTATSCNNTSCPAGTTDCKTATQKACCTSTQKCDNGQCKSACTAPASATCNVVHLGQPAGVACYNPTTQCCYGNDLSRSVHPISDCNSSPTSSSTSSSSSSSSGCGCTCTEHDQTAPDLCVGCGESPSGCSDSKGRTCSWIGLSSGLNGCVWQ